MYESKKRLRNYIGFKADPVVIMAVDKHAYQSGVNRSEYCRDAVIKKTQI